MFGAIESRNPETQSLILTLPNRLNPKPKTLNSVSAFQAQALTNPSRVESRQGTRHDDRVLKGSFGVLGFRVWVFWFHDYFAFTA